MTVQPPPSPPPKDGGGQLAGKWRPDVQELVLEVAAQKKKAATVPLLALTLPKTMGHMGRSRFSTDRSTQSTF